MVMPSWVVSIIAGIFLLAIGGSLVTSDIDIQPILTIGWVTIVGGVIILGLTIKSQIS